MNRPADPLIEVIGALVVHSWTSYSWLGERVDATSPDGGQPTPAAARSSFVSQLAGRLYADFYCLGYPAPSNTWTEPHREPWPSEAVRVVARANASRGTVMDGWTLIQERDGELLIERGPLRVTARPDQVVRGSSVPGSSERIQVIGPKEHLGGRRGFYTAYGERQTHDPMPDRFYWNASAASRAALIGAVTDRLNRLGIPFRVKVANDLESPRADNGVLYTERRDRASVLTALPALYREVSAGLRSPTPAFTKRLASGMSFAESPVADRSFGTHRCELLAEGLASAFERGARDAPAVLGVVAAQFAEHGVSLQRPYLNSGSPDLPPVQLVGG